MPAISSDQLLLVNVTEIDEQHLGIVAMINRYHDALLSSDPDRLDEEREMIRPCADTLASHFQAEQEFMAAIGYDRLSEHTSKHRAFLDRIEEVSEDAKNGFVPLNSELIKTLSGWFLTHETEEDRGYADFYRARSNG